MYILQLDNMAYITGKEPRWYSFVLSEAIKFISKDDAIKFCKEDISSSFNFNNLLMWGQLDIMSEEEILIKEIIE